MKALTLYQPYASAMALGLKRIETRSWSVRYRGPVIIHAARKFTRSMEDEFDLRYRIPEDARAFAPVFSVRQLPRGQVVAIGDLVDIVPVESLTGITAQERRWGDYSAGRYGWIFSHLRRIDGGREVAGMQGLWNWPARYGDVLNPSI